MNFLRIFLLSFFTFGCSKEQHNSLDDYNKIRIEENSTAFVMTKNNLTGEEKRIELKSQSGDILLFKIETPKDQQDVPTFQEVIANMIGGKQLGHQQDNQGNSVHLPNGLFTYEQTPSENPTRLNFQWQNPFHPELVHLRKNEKLDLLVKNKSEIEAFITLLNWTRQQWEPSSPNPYPKWNANKILSLIRSKKTGGFCGQYSQVLAQALTSLGYQARFLWLNKHFALEVYSNSLEKWVILDPLYNCVLKKADIYLNAFEAYQLLLESVDTSALTVFDTTINKGISGEKRQKILSAYTRFVIDLKTDHLEENKSGTYYVSNYWKHAAVFGDTNLNSYDFKGKLPLITPYKDDLYPNINKTQIKLHSLNATHIFIELKSDMPFKKSFEYSYDSGKSYSQAQSRMRFQLKSGSAKILFRAVNSSEIRGPSSFFSYTFIKK
ncbi:MAG: transglutaminase domain-containing protein [Lentisphaeraceae bacterium]|nr:transglutaminase domain-containing protein [Lentisphaeraceae bacterium]